MEAEYIADNLLTVILTIAFAFVVIVAVVNAVQSENQEHPRRSRKGDGCAACTSWDDMGRRL